MMVDIKALAKHLDEKWGEKACPMCGSTDWHLDGTVHEVRPFVFDNAAAKPGLRVLPLVSVLCGDCGNTVFVNVAAAELAPQTEGDSEQPHDHCGCGHDHSKE